MVLCKNFFLVQTLRIEKYFGEFFSLSGSLFYMASIVFYFPLLSLRANGRPAVWPTLIQ